VRPYPSVMAGSPKKRARREAAARAGDRDNPAENPAVISGESVTKAAAKRKPKPRPKPKPKAARRISTRSKQATAKASAAVADEHAHIAKNAGATGPRLTAAKKQLRDSAIIARTAQGLSPSVIAAEFDVTVRTVERVLAEQRSLPSPLDDRPMKLLEDLARGYRLAIGDYEAMAVAWFEVNQSAALGAKKAADETRARLATLLGDVGKMPSNLELFRSEMEMQRIAEEMVRIMRAVAAGELDPSEAVEFFRGLVAAEQQRQLTAGQ
jgi:uncharacterized protein (DUF433 family)